MPKIKVPTTSLKRIGKPRKSFDVHIDSSEETHKENKNGLKMKERLRTLFKETCVNQESEVFGGFSLTAVLEEYSELSAALQLLPPHTVSRPQRSSRGAKKKAPSPDEHSTSSSDDDTSSDSEQTSSTPPPPSPASLDYNPAPKSSRRGVLLTKAGGVRKRGMRCGECVACQRPDDCGVCDFCRDKPKFGGPGIKKQACIYRKCHNLIRQVPLKCKPKRVFIPDGSPPPRKATLTETPPLHASPIRPRKFFTIPECSVLRSKVTEEEIPHLNIFWPIEADISGTPIYSVKSITSRPSVCLKCGGAGKMIRCLVCCQPFHSYCVGIKGQESYTCPSCVTCRVCGQGSNCVVCVVCEGHFHERCVSDHTSTRFEGVWRCVGCTRCRSCKTTIPGKEKGATWYEDYTYCEDCHSLKVKGNYCPLCGECYSDSDYDSKMVQCGRCDHWVHASCEGMSDQDYEILSDLPEDSVLFLCRLCDQGHSKLSWKPAVDQFLQESLIKLLECFGRGRSEFKQLSLKVHSKEYTSLNMFNHDLCSILADALSSLVASSSAHRQLTTAQNSYEDLLSQLFPWFKGDDIKDGSREATPLKYLTDWPECLSHDHCYWLPGATKEEVGAIISATPDVDQRRCVLCTIVGDTGSEGPGRLLPCGVDEWIHVNCAVWSAEVYEEVTGVLRCVQVAITRGSRLRCDSCREVGATVGCCTSSCSANYHYQCAREAKCAFLRNKEVYCQRHREGVASEDVLSDLELTVVDRCVFVDAHPDRQGRKMPRRLEAAKITMQLGSLVVSELGQLRELSDTPTTLLPHTYTASCDFWSVACPLSISRYTLSITAAKPEDWITILETTPSNKTPLIDEELGMPSVDVGVSNSIWEDLLPPPSKKVKVQPAETSKPITLPKLKNGIKHQTTPTTLLSALTFVPIVHDSQILLYPAQYLNGLSPTKEHPDTPFSPNTRGIEDFKILKRTSSKDTTPTLQAGATPSQVQSDEVVENSVTLQRLRAGLHGNPLSLTFKVTSSDGRSWLDSRLEEVWWSVLAELQEQRAKLDLPFVPYSPEAVYRQFGLGHPLVVQLIEQLPQASLCSEYQFQYHRPSHSKDWRSLRALDNRSGCARSEPFNGIRSPRDMFSFLTSDHRPEPPPIDHMALEIIMATAENTGVPKLQMTSDLPAAMRYRNLQKTYKQHVGVFGSKIHGLGLFCVKEIDAGDMVIEYTGTVIRSVLTDKREKIYDSKGIGCYMFRIDVDDVVDATMSGNQARFINHSCEPNCYSKVITCDGNKKIMIFALRKILPGEELTYDYKFPLEDAKIPCNCGARRCRKTMN